MTPGAWRRLWLVVLIVLDILMLICWWFVNIQFFWVFIGINVCVLVGEVVSVVMTKKTLSTNTTHALVSGGTKRIVGYAAITLMVLCLMALWLHLGWIWGQ